MGNQQDYIESGGFSQYLYKDYHGFDAKEVNGKTIRYSDKARYMTDAEIKKYGPIIKVYNPHVKFR